MVVQQVYRPAVLWEQTIQTASSAFLPDHPVHRLLRPLLRHLPRHIHLLENSSCPYRRRIHRLRHRLRHHRRPHRHRRRLLHHRRHHRLRRRRRRPLCFVQTPADVM